jgi:CRISPR/Cas system CMR-associated protein Cmr3 (group 5 of RAMP superfamily)
MPSLHRLRTCAQSNNNNHHRLRAMCSDIRTRNIIGNKGICSEITRNIIGNKGICSEITRNIIGNKAMCLDIRKTNITDNKAYAQNDRH